MIQIPTEKQDPTGFKPIMIQLCNALKKAGKQSVKGPNSPTPCFCFEMENGDSRHPHFRIDEEVSENQPIIILSLCWLMPVF